MTPRAAPGLWLGCLTLAIAALLGLIAGALLTVNVTAAPRSTVQPAIPQGASSLESEAVPIAPATSGNLAERSSGASRGQATAGYAPGVASGPADAEHSSGAPSPSPATTDPPAIAGGIASWCAPTPTQCQRWGGRAKLGAVPSFRWGDRPYRVNVCRQDDPDRCVAVTVVSYCGCPDGRIIDLSPSAFLELEVQSRGLVPVMLEDLPL